jgi:hypothetical protein
MSMDSLVHSFLAYAGSPEWPVVHVAGRSEFLFDKIKISTNAAVCQSTEVIRFFEQLKTSFDMQHIALFQDEELLACSSDWYNLHLTD